MRHGRGARVAALARFGACALLPLLAACVAPVGVVRAPAPGLQRSRYVLPPEPPPPTPRSLEEQRALEAEWPPVSAFPEDPAPPDGPLRVRAVVGAGPVIHHVGPRPCAGPVQTVCSTTPVVRVHVVRDRHRAAPRIVIVRGR